MTAPPLTDAIKESLAPLLGKNATVREQEDMWAFIWDQRGVSTRTFEKKYRTAIDMAKTLARTATVDPKGGW